jgi:hypothetical protein
MVKQSEIVLIKREFKSGHNFKRGLSARTAPRLYYNVQLSYVFKEFM